jgi:hypothetical protein
MQFGSVVSCVACRHVLSNTHEAQRMEVIGKKTLAGTRERVPSRLKPFGVTVDTKKTKTIMPKKATPKSTDALIPAAELELEKATLLVTDPTTLEKTLAKAVQKEQLFRTLQNFAALDHQSEVQSTSAGEFLYKFLALPLETQKKAVWEMADYLKLPRPTYESSGPGRPTKGRNELAAVMYGAYQDMLVKDRGKDTRAAKRITDHVRRWQIKTGLKQDNRKLQSTSTSDDNSRLPARAAKTSFKALWDVSRSDNERRTIVSLFLRLGIEPNDMDKWTERGLLTLATSPLDAITVEAKEATGA